MVKNLSHNDWVKQQFEAKYLRRSYRNVVIHSSIIEGTLVNSSGKKRNTFDEANKSLSHTGKISSSEFCIFNEIRNIRNQLVHESFKNKLVQNQIDGLRDDLMKKIHEAYKMSSFLNEKLFKKYNLERPSCIIFKPESK